MDDFNKYEELRERGLGPHEVYQVARTDGFDLITSIRLLRKVFGLSLAEAKEASRMLDVLNTKQKLVPGGTVYWEGATSEEGFYIMEARVTRIADGLVYLEGHKKYHISDSGLEEAPTGLRMTSLPVEYFDRTLAERISDAMRSWQELSQISAVRKAV